MADTTAALPSVILLAVRRDFQCLQQHCESKGWNDDTPVPSEVLGHSGPMDAPKVGLRIDDDQNAESAVRPYAVSRAGQRQRSQKGNRDEGL